MKLLVLTAPSGAGKTTIAKRLMAQVPGLQFSVSATTRSPREGEVADVHYHFLTVGDFEERLAAGDFLEHEEVYPGRFYGTLRPELEALAARDDVRAVVLDIDVKGALNVKRMYGDAVRTLFVAPPSLGALADRLHARGTEDEARIAVRLERAEMEMATASEFDVVVVNDDLDQAVGEDRSPRPGVPRRRLGGRRLGARAARRAARLLDEAGVGPGHQPPRREQVDDLGRVARRVPRRAHGRPRRTTKATSAALNVWGASGNRSKT